jgi:hypothetical protein
LFIQTNVQLNALTGWIKTKHYDQAPLNGMPVAFFAKLVKAVESNTESYMGGKKCWAFI